MDLVSKGFYKKMIPAEVIQTVARFALMWPPNARSLALGL